MPDVQPVAAPFAGHVRLLVDVGDVVEAGQALAAVEAMKMEAVVTAPRAGTVTSVLVEDGPVTGGDALLELA